MDSRDKLAMCRLCLCENECFINVFELNDWQGYVAANVIADLLQFQVSETDGYPHVVCSKCILKLTDFKLFKECCLKSKVVYDNMFVSSESLEKHQSEMLEFVTVKAEPIFYSDNEDDISKMKLIESGSSENSGIVQSTATEMKDSSMPIIKEEELNIDSSGNGSDKTCEVTKAEVSFGPILLKHEVLPFSKDIHAQEKLIESEVFENADAVEPAASSKEDSSQYNDVVRYRTVDNMEDAELPYSYGDDHGVMSGVNDQECYQHTKTSPKNAAKGNRDEIESSKEVINVQRAAYICGDSHATSISTDRKFHHSTSNKVACADLCTRDVISEDISMFKESRNTSVSVDVEASSSGMIGNLKGQLIHRGERVSERGEDVGMGTTAERGIEGEKGKFECYHCGKVLLTKSNLIRHMKLHGFGTSHNCIVCGKLFQTNSVLIRHLLTHTGLKPFKCPECSKCYTDYGNLKTHMISHMASKPYKCDKCSKSFSANSNLIRHMRSHTGSKPYKCGECSKGFSENFNLKTHMRLHTGYKPYNCVTCSKSFSDISNLKTHMRSHTGSKPYKCTECSKSFRVNSNLVAHMRSHTGSKPYKCLVCSKSFSFNSTLKSHMRSHSGCKPYNCEECSKCFSAKCSLKMHMRLHTGSKPFKCGTCSKGFAQKGGLKRHLMVHSKRKDFTNATISQHDIV